MYGCIDIPRCSCIGMDSVDDPLKGHEPDAAHVAKGSLALTLVPRIGDVVIFLHHGNVFDSILECRCDGYEPSDYGMGQVIASAYTGKG